MQETKDGSKSLPSIWNSVAYFDNRYRFSLRVPIAINYDKCKLIGTTNSAMVQINEVTKVELSKSGIAEATMKEQWRLMSRTRVTKFSCFQIKDAV